jgi:hypothetical protein
MVRASDRLPTVDSPSVVNLINDVRFDDYVEERYETDLHPSNSSNNDIYIVRLPNRSEVDTDKWLTTVGC